MVPSERGDHFRPARHLRALPEGVGIEDRIAEEELEMGAVGIHRPYAMPLEHPLVHTIIPPREHHPPVIHHCGAVIRQRVSRNSPQLAAIPATHEQRPGPVGLTDIHRPVPIRDKQDISIGQLGRANVITPAAGDLLEI